jgi:hypothetical protein
MRMLAEVAAMTLVAGLAAAALSASPALVFAVFMVALMAWAVPAFLEWRRSLRLQLAGEPAARRVPPLASEAGPA